MTELVAPFVPVHGSWTFLPDMNCLHDPSGRSIRLSVPCASCEKTYIGETGRKPGVRLQEHRSEVESKTNRAFTRSHRSSSSAESNRSALTDHGVQENHVISWSAASVNDRESDRSTRCKEAVHIRKEGPGSMNRDEGSYQLSHTYDRFLGSTLTCRAKNRKKT